jgi:hypothetical protein
LLCEFGAVEAVSENLNVERGPFITFRGIEKHLDLAVIAYDESHVFYFSRFLLAYLPSKAAGVW